MYFVSRLNGRTEGTRYCAGAGFVISTGFALAPFRSLLPGHVVNVLSNTLIFWGSCLLLRGIRGFRGLKVVRLRRFNFMVALYAALFAYWTYGYDSIRARAILASLGLAATMAACAGSMGFAVPRRDRPVYWTTASFYVLTAVSALLRAIWFLRATPHASIFSFDPIEFFSIAAVNLAAMGGAFGLCLATNLRLMRETEELALYDPLTGLPNRRLFEKRLALAEKRALHTGHPLALIYCDLDAFKDVNDKLGHAAGDRVLRVVADRLRGLFDEDACLARVGGDEFIVLIENAGSREKLNVLIEKVSHAVEEQVYLEGVSISPAISCGLALYPDEVGNASDLVRLADAAMYAMKQNGRVASYLQT